MGGSSKASIKEMEERLEKHRKNKKKKEEEEKKIEKEKRKKLEKKEEKKKVEKKKEDKKKEEKKKKEEDKKDKKKEDKKKEDKKKEDKKKDKKSSKDKSKDDKKKSSSEDKKKSSKKGKSSKKKSKSDTASFNDSVNTASTAMLSDDEEDEVCFFNWGMYDREDNSSKKTFVVDETTTVTIDKRSDEQLRRNAYNLYTRLGKPKRDKFLELCKQDSVRALADPISRYDIDLLPWILNGKKVDQGQMLKYLLADI